MSASISDNVCWKLFSLVVKLEAVSIFSSIFLIFCHFLANKAKILNALEAEICLIGEASIPTPPQGLPLLRAWCPLRGSPEAPHLQARRPTHTRPPITREVFVSGDPPAPRDKRPLSLLRKPSHCKGHIQEEPRRDGGYTPDTWGVLPPSAHVTRDVQNLW